MGAYKHRYWVSGADAGRNTLTTRGRVEGIKLIAVCSSNTDVDFRFFFFSECSNPPQAIPPPLFVKRLCFGQLLVVKGEIGKIVTVQLLPKNFVVSDTLSHLIG